jgi:adenylate cyclase
VAEPDERTQTFLFADLAGFTALTEVHGDEEAADVAEEFFRAVRAFLLEYGAQEVKAMGDALMVRVADPECAVRLGLRIVHDVGSSHGFPAVRVGMHTGPAVERNGDWFGATVNLAARTSAAAGGGEVLLTAATAERVREHPGVSDLILHPRGRRELRNIPEPVELFEAASETSRSIEGLPIDPVCRMAIDPEHCAGELEHEGRVFHFCSLECAGKFAASPDRYGGAVAAE